MASKRTRNIQLERMRKNPSIRRMAPVAAVIGASLSMTACSSKEPVIMVSSIDDCKSKTNLSEAQCEFAYQQALQEAQRTAPKFQAERDCEDNFGFHNCVQADQGYFMPVMAGFLVAEVIDEIGDAYSSRYYSPVYRNKYREPVLADGSGLSYGSGGYSSYRVSKKANSPQPTVSKVHPKGTKTISRGGFGSTASAKSSWGGGSSSRSWGG